MVAGFTQKTDRQGYETNDRVAVPGRFCPRLYGVEALIGAFNLQTNGYRGKAVAE
jgi:hypothetical protein